MPGGVGCTTPANQKALERYDRVSARTRKVPAAEPSPPIRSPAVEEPEVGSNEASEEREKVSLACGTDITMSDIDALVEENQKLKDECKHLQKEVCDLRTVVDVYQDEDGVKFFTGLPNCALFVALLQYILGHYQPKHSRILPHAQQLLMVLMKLRLGLLNKDLARRFRISCSSVSQICSSWIDILSRELRPCIFWPHMDDIRRRLPRLCKVPLFNNLRCAIDCSEVFIERPLSYKARSQTFSQYKHHNTLKFLIGICPSGGISYISQCWGGRVSDLELTKRSGFLDLVQEGDLIMADQGFHIEELLALRGASLLIPASTRGKPQLSRKDAEISRRISQVRIQVERTIGQLKTFRIFKSILSISQLKRKGEQNFANIEKILIIAAAIVNMKGKIFSPQTTSREQ
ncbi:unnamed protein product [Ixodes persulcatus]